MKSLLQTTSILLIALLLSQCDAITGEEIARLSIDEVSTEENWVLDSLELDLLKDEEIKIWSHMDMSYEGDIGFSFVMQVLQDGEIYDEFEFDPTESNFSIGEVRTSFGNKTNWSFTKKSANMLVPDDGTYTFKAYLISSENETLELEEADLILKK